LRRFGQKSAGALLLEKLPFLLLSVACSIITFVCQRNAGTVSETVSLGYRLSNALISYVRYLGKLLWPQDLAFFYPHPERWPYLCVLAASLLLASVSLLVIWFRQRQPV